MDNNGSFISVKERQKIMEKEFIVTFRSSIQLTEDRREVVNPVMRVTCDTTIGEIEAFYHKWNKDGRMEVKIIELSQL